MAKPISKDPFDLSRVIRACDKEVGYFTITTEEVGEFRTKYFVLNTANQDRIFDTGSEKQLRTYLEGIHKGCLIGRGLVERARQTTLLGGKTKAPRAEKSLPPGQQSLFKRGP